MNISDCMKRQVVSIEAQTTIREAAAIVVKKHIGVLPVVDADERPIGVISMGDLLKLELPDFVNFMADVDFVHDFGAAEVTRPPAKRLAKTIKSLMQPVLTVDEDCGLLRAYALMLQQDLHDIPVIDRDGKLCGIASRVDIAVAILSTWEKGN